PGIPLLFSVYFLTFLAFSLFYAGLPIYANTLLKWTAIDLGIFLAYSSFIMILVQGPVLSRLSDKMPNQSLILIGSLFLTSSFLLLSMQDIIVLYIANTLLSIGNGLMWPSFLALLAGTGSPQMQGAIQGYGNSTGSFASMLGLILGGLLFENIGTMVFFVGGIIFLIITILMTINFLQRRKRKNVPAEPVPV
ncbi:MAG: MFS transporter, partial [Bacteroidota bacterium]